MSLNLYSVSVPVMLHHLDALSALLTKGEEYTKANKIPEADFMTAKLAPDMLPLTFQIQTISNGIKGLLTRVAGVEIAVVEDKESTFAELQERITFTKSILTAAKESDFAGKESAEVVLKIPSAELKFTGVDYVLKFALPNFYFHFTTAYNILRHLGVEVGKRDFLGKIQ